MAPGRRRSASRSRKDRTFALFHHTGCGDPHESRDDRAKASTMTTTHLHIDADMLARYCERHHIRRMSLFGSVLSGTAGPESDIDLLVEFERGQEPGLIGLAGMEAELSTLLGGRRVDLRTPADLSRYFRDHVLHTAELQYGR